MKRDIVNKKVLSKPEQQWNPVESPSTINPHLSGSDTIGISVQHRVKSIPPIRVDLSPSKVLRFRTVKRDR